MVIALVVLVLQPVVIVCRHIDFAAYYRFYVRMFLREFEEFLYSVHVPVVGDGEPGHAELFCPVEKVFDRSLAVQDGILRMYVKVNE